MAQAGVEVFWIAGNRDFLVGPIFAAATGATLLDDPAAKAVFVKYLPDVAKSPSIDQARSMTLKSIQQFKPDMITDKALADMDADLAKLPVKK